MRLPTFYLGISHHNTHVVEWLSTSLQTAASGNILPFLQNISRIYLNMSLSPLITVSSKSSINSTTSIDTTSTQSWSRVLSSNEPILSSPSSIDLKAWRRPTPTSSEPLTEGGRYLPNSRPLEITTSFFDLYPFLH